MLANNTSTMSANTGKKIDPKPEYCFFLSYARKNAGKPLNLFFDDLANYVRDREGGDLDISKTAFCDQETIKTGDPWSEKLLHALQTSQVLVYLLSVDYIQSDFCGKEFQVFLERVRIFKRDNRDGKPMPTYFLPVIWVPPAAPNLPEVIAACQTVDKEFRLSMASSV